MCAELKIKTNLNNNINIILYYNLKLHMQRSIFSKCKVLRNDLISSTYQFEVGTIVRVH